MTTASTRALISLLPLGLLACGSDSDQIVFGMQAQSFANSEWSAPVNLGPAINSTANDQQASLSPDGLSLYFESNRPGAVGGSALLDIWVSRRACADCPWETAANLGPVINTTSTDGGPVLSIDAHLLFFHSARPGGEGANDIYVSHRADPNDDFGWEPPVNLGPRVNGPTNDFAPDYLQSAEDGPANLYFGRVVIEIGALQDIFSAAVTRDGRTLGPAVVVAELSDQSANDAAPTVRADGREILFWSTRAGGFGAGDLWAATRRSVHDPWSAPVNLAGLLNTGFNEFRPDLSRDGRTLLFDSDRPGAGGTDLWMSTRTPSGH